MNGYYGRRATAIQRNAKRVAELDERYGPFADQPAGGTRPGTCGPHTATKRTDNLATSGPAVLESFLAEVDRRCTDGMTTRLRYLKLLDRLCRAMGLREANPARLTRREQPPRSMSRTAR
jgi:hypothetical protein